MWTARYFYRILIKFGIYRQIFIGVPQYQISWKTFHWKTRWYKQTDGLQGGQRDGQKNEGKTNSMKQFPTKTATLWRRNDAGSNITHFFLHVKCQIFFSVLIEFGFSLQIFIKLPNARFHRNPPSLSRADIWREKEGQDEGNT